MFKNVLLNAFLGERPRGGQGSESATRRATSSQRKYRSENTAELP